MRFVVTHLSQGSRNVRQGIPWAFKLIADGPKTMRKLIRDVHGAATVSRHRTWHILGPCHIKLN